jgi:hypothetical protein
VSKIFLENEKLDTHFTFNAVTELLDCPECDRTTPKIEWMMSHLLTHYLKIERRAKAEKISLTSVAEGEVNP